jgi:two-component system C4-dicarboxylate transport sensor histidine kinase DctB
VKPVDLAQLVVRVVQECTGDAGTTTHRVNTILSEALPPVRTDPRLLSEALTELLKNALQAKGSHHIELRVQTDPFDDRLKIEVRDDGDGMTEHTLQHAFDPFFSARPAGRQPGLGLARARRFIEAHGGRVSLENAPNGGAVATIWLRDWRGAEPGDASSDREVPRVA